MGPELRGGLIDGEPRRISGDLEQHSPRLAEVDRMEVLPIDDGRDADTFRLYFGALRELGTIIARAVSDVMYCAHTTSATPESRRSAEIHYGATSHVIRLKAVNGSFFTDRPKTQPSDQQICSAGITIFPNCCAVETPDCALRRHWSFGPWRDVARPRRSHQLQEQPVRVLEREYLLVEPPGRTIILDAVGQQPLDPESQSGWLDSEGDGADLSGSLASRPSARPREKCQERARVPQLVTIVQVIAGRIIEVHRELHQAHPQDTGIEIQVALRVTGNGGDMVDGHGIRLPI
jgi:hypothetical protein